MLTLDWVKCQDDRWCNLETLNLESVGGVSGVYVIWHRGDNPRWVRVGQGKIKDRLAAHRKDPKILAHRLHGLFVTWAAVDPSQVDGVEAFLADRCDPLVGDRFPERSPIQVNLPE